MAVIQFYSTDGPMGTEWQNKTFGVLSFVRDPQRESYYFQLFCPIQHELLWEHELYNGLQYQNLTTFFHCFESEVNLFMYSNSILRISRGSYYVVNKLKHELLNIYY